MRRCRVPEGAIRAGRARRADRNDSPDAIARCGREVSLCWLAGTARGPGIGIEVTCDPPCEPTEAARHSREKVSRSQGASQEPMMKAFAYGEGATLRRKHDAENRKRTSDEHSARSCSLRRSIRTRGRS